MARVRTRHPKALIALTVVAVAAGGVLAYGWTTRRAPVKFSHGGTFGTPTASPGAGETVVRYLYAAGGSESVKLGKVTGCSWRVPSVAITAKTTGAQTILDQEIGKRLERRIVVKTAQGLSMSYTASTVTCLGIRTTAEDTYATPVLSFKLPLRVGMSWSTHGVSTHRTEDTLNTVLRQETVTTKAGRFATYVVRARSRLTGGQTGTVDTTYWFAPSLGMWVKETAISSVDQSGTRFVSSFTTTLAGIA